MNPFKRTWFKLTGQDTKVRAILNEEIVERYVLTGTQFGDALSYIYMGECVGFDDLLKAYEEAEAAYVGLGFRTLSVDDFTDAGGWGMELRGLRVPRDVDEEPILHAKYYRAHYLGRARPVIDFDRMMKDGQPQMGNYAVPSTAHLEKKR